MMLWHVTPEANIPSIFLWGLLCSEARGKLKAVWLVKRRDAVAQAQSVAKRHNVAVSEVAYIMAAVPRSRIYRAARGKFFTLVDVEPKRMVKVDVASSVN